VRNLIRQAKIEQIYRSADEHGARMVTMSSHSRISFNGGVISTDIAYTLRRPDQPAGILERAGTDIPNFGASAVRPGGRTSGQPSMA
jgi:hypothetical protein